MSDFNVKGFIAFLRGEVSLDGRWFGNEGPIENGRRHNFWWRRYLPQLLGHLDRQDERIAGLRAELDALRAAQKSADKPFGFMCSLQDEAGDVVMRKYRDADYSFMSCERDGRTVFGLPDRDYDGGFLYSEQPLYAAPVAQQAKVPDDVVTVPIAPTEEMVIAALREVDPLRELIDWQDGHGFMRDDVRRAWSAMLAAKAKGGVA